MTMRTKSGRFWQALLAAGLLGGRETGDPFTAAEVRRCLAEHPPGARVEAVRRCLADPAAWLPPEPHFARCPLQYQQRLARIVFWYAHGESLAAIDRRLSRYRAEATPPPTELNQAIEEACRRIATCLNTFPRDYGL